MRLISRGGLLSRLAVNFQHLKGASDSQGLEVHRRPPTSCRSWKIPPFLAMSTNAPSAGQGNRLRLEKSPYLLQHANNPIDWYPFGQEAISKAKSEDKPIFLSVGYATCHWCHVMEHESFMSAEVAEIMNEHFVCIKVDREERPDIDKIYMAFLLMINRSGGWPMNVWLTPDLTPITAGTYFPPESRWGVPGFKSVLRHIADKWERERESLLTTGQSVIKILEKSVDVAAEESEDGVTIAGKCDEAIKIFKYSFDKDWGGFNGAPKFPEVSKLNFLLHGYLLKQDKELLNAVTKSLRRIAQGGIHDHVFGGFSRYAVDRKWHVPHFEKMLYDQAQLMSVYANTFKVTRDPFYLAVCEKTFEYLVTDLCHPAGGFYSGEDADSYPSGQSQGQKIEGSFYAWTLEEIRERFETESGRFPETAEPELPFQLFCDHFDVRDGGNVSPDNDPHGHFVGKNILFAKGTVEETERRYTGVDVQQVLQIGCELLNEERKLRPRPELDTKLICAWNGLMLAGLSHLVAISEGPQRERYLAQARKLVDFVSANFYDAERKTLRRSCYGDADKLAECRLISGFLDDYAFLIRGLLAFYLVSMDNAVLVWAKELQETQDRLFFDEENGGYYYTQEGSEHVVVRLKEDHDGAEPCGNSVTITNLLQLGTYFDEKRFKANAHKSINFFRSTGALGYPMPELLSGSLLLDHGLDMLVVVGPKVEATENLLRIAQQAYAPGLVAFHLQTDNPESVLRESVKSFKMVNNSPTVYLCHNKVCQLPITDARKLEETLESRFEASN